MKRLVHSALLPVLLLAVAFTTSNCALILHGQHQEMQARSTPSGARILIDGQERGTTPTTLQIDRDDEHTATFQMEGYDDVQINIDRDFKVGSAIIGNVLSWGIVGIVADVATGAAYEMTPNELAITLDENGMTSRVEADKHHLQVIFFTPDQVPAAAAR